MQQQQNVKTRWEFLCQRFQSTREIGANRVSRQSLISLRFDVDVPDRS